MKIYRLKNSIKSLVKELNVDVEIFNNNYQPVLNQGVIINNCQVAKNVFETENKFLLIQRGKHYLCHGCGQNCSIESGIFLPLKLNGYSVFSIVAYTKEQQDILLNKQDKYINIAKSIVEILETTYVFFDRAGDISANNTALLVTLDSILGNDPIFNNLKEKVKKIASRNATVLITGESGTGKDLFARAIHNESSRKQYPFIALNCGAIPETLLESELFGYAPGSFTGANPSGKKGKFELANKGTIFLDEIGDMPYLLQQKLLRVLETKYVEPIGGVSSKELDVRVIAATNQNLRELVRKGKFRQDLYFRLNVLSIHIPPLRLRKKDISILTDYFLDLFKREIGAKEIKGFSPDVKKLFLQYKWPGNIRELKNIVEYAVSLGEEPVLDVNHLPIWFWESLLEDTNLKLINLPLENLRDDILTQLLQSPESVALLKSLSLNEKKKLADKLGVSIATLYRKLNIN